MLPSLIINSFFVALLGTGLLAVLGLNLLSRLNLIISPIPAIIGLFLLLLLSIPIYNYFVRKINYSNTEYHLFDDHIEYFNGFMTVEKRSIPYNKITEISLQKGMIQKRYGLGTLHLDTATTPNSQTDIPGITIPDVSDADTVYAKAKEVITDSKNRTA